VISLRFRRQAFTLRFIYGLAAAEITCRLNVSAEELEAALAAAFLTVRERMTPLLDERIRECDGE